jgi:signal transduction histidine kinase
MNDKIEKLNVKLADSERLKGDFLSNIRNEINNPLTSILVMSREIFAPNKDEQAKQLMAEMIYNEAFELDFQLRNIFTAAELEAGDMGLHISRVETARLIEALVAAFGHKIREKNVTVTIVTRSDQPDDDALLFSTDADKLYRVLANLLANAVEYNMPGKTVRIEVWKEAGTLHASIADEGIGIPQEERGRLFERFRQLDRGTTKKHRGQGLGLSITRALVEMLNGTVALCSAPGGGCVFRIDLPEALGASDEYSSDGNTFLFESEKKF